MILPCSFTLKRPGTPLPDELLELEEELLELLLDELLELEELLELDELLEELDELELDELLELEELLDEESPPAQAASINEHTQTHKTLTKLIRSVINFNIDIIRDPIYSGLLNPDL